MKTALLLRHGKSDWDAQFDADVDRPLAQRGITSAQRMGRFVTEAGILPDLALTSPAVRATTTLRLAAAAGGWDCPIRVEPGLYGGSSITVMEIMRGVSDRIQFLVLTGHQPTWGNLTSQLIGGARVIFPTAAVACIEFQLNSWRDLRPGSGELRWLVPPRILPK